MPQPNRSWNEDICLQAAGYSQAGLILTLGIPLLCSPGSGELRLWERPEVRGRKWGSGSGNGRGRSGPVGGGGACVWEGKARTPAAGRSPQVGAPRVGVGVGREGGGLEGPGGVLSHCPSHAGPCSGGRQAGGRRGLQVCVREGHYCVTPSRHSLLLEASPRPSLPLPVNSLRAVAGLSRLCGPVPSAGPAWNTVVILKRLLKEWSGCQGTTLATGSWFSLHPSR